MIELNTWYEALITIIGGWLLFAIGGAIFIFGGVLTSIGLNYFK